MWYLNLRSKESIRIYPPPPPPPSVPPLSHLHHSFPGPDTLNWLNPDPVRFRIRNHPPSTPSVHPILFQVRTSQKRIRKKLIPDPGVKKAKIKLVTSLTLFLVRILLTDWIRIQSGSGSATIPHPLPASVHPPLPHSFPGRVSKWSKSS